MNIFITTSMLTTLLSLCLFSPARASDFSGNLKEVTITDSQTANKPPVATFTHTVNGNTVSFNASGSTDPDGTIAEYKWDFGDSTKSTGLSVQHTYQNNSNTYVTLTITDNYNAITIISKKILFQTCSQTPSYAQSLIGGNTGWYLGGYSVGALYTGTNSYTICSLAFNIHSIVGNIDSQIYSVNIYTRSEKNLGALLATKKIPGSSIITGWNNITLDSPISTGTSGFAIVISGPMDATNYPIISTMNSDGESVWSTHRWVGAADNITIESDMALRLYQ